MKNLLIILICFTFYACNDSSSLYFMQQEKDLINNGNNDETMRVVLITNIEDSVFLRQKSKNISIDDKNLPKLIKRMRATMDVEGGVGIAAVQVGIQRNVILIKRFDKSGHVEKDISGKSTSSSDNHVDVFINPKVISYSIEKQIFIGDGCLSIPQYWGNTERHTSVEVEYYNEKGKLIRETIYGTSRPNDFTAVIFQHEFDHLQGTLFLDRIYKNELFFEEEQE